MRTDPSEVQLTPEQQIYIAGMADQSGRPWQELLQEFVPTPIDRLPAGESALEVAERLGLVGCCDGDPPDLATNPEHMRGFGE